MYTKAGGLSQHVPTSYTYEIILILSSYLCMKQENLESHLENKTKETFAKATLHVGTPHCLDLHMSGLHIPLYSAMTATVTVSSAHCSWIISTVILLKACYLYRIGRIQL
jgi:hypothetical protein